MSSVLLFFVRFSGLSSRDFAATIRLVIRAGGCNCSRSNQVWDLGLNILILFLL
jgi:hypothetical protein